MYEAIKVNSFTMWHIHPGQVGMMCNVIKQVMKKSIMKKTLQYSIFVYSL